MTSERVDIRTRRKKAPYQDTEVPAEKTKFQIEKLLGILGGACVTIADQKVHTQPRSSLQEEADARGIDNSMLAAMMEEYRRLYGAEPETLPQLICGVTC